MLLDFGPWNDQEIILKWMKPDLTLKLPVVINMKLLLIIYPYIIRQTGNENIKTYQGEAAILI